MRLINYKYELKIEYCLDINDKFNKKILYQLMDYEYYQNHKFDDVKILIESYNFNDILKYLINHNEI